MSKSRASKERQDWPNIFEARANFTFEQLWELGERLTRSESTPIEFGLEDVLQWADGVRAAQGTELANRITPEEARIAWAIHNAPR